MGRMERGREREKKEETAGKEAVYSAACLFNALFRASHTDNGPCQRFQYGSKGIMMFTGGREERRMAGEGKNERNYRK